MTNLLSRATLARIRAFDPIGAAALEVAGDMTPPRATRPNLAPSVVIDNRRQLMLIMRDEYGRGEPAGDDGDGEVMEGEWSGG